MWQTELAQSHVATPKPCHKHSLNVVTYKIDLTLNVFTLLSDLPKVFTHDIQLMRQTQPDHHNSRHLARSTRKLKTGSNCKGLVKQTCSKSV